MANRDADNIRRIVGADEINRGLEAAEQKEPIPGLRGVAYLAATEGPGARGSVAKGTTTAADSTAGFAEGSGDGTSMNQQSQQAQMAGTIAKAFDPANPDSWVRGEDNGVYDVGGLIDGTAGPGLIDPDTGYMSDVLTGLDGLRDCSDTTDIKLFSSANFPAPDGWDDAETPPTGDDPTWQSGYYWKSVWAFSTPQATPRQAAAEIEAGVANRTFKEFSPAYGPSETSITAVFYIGAGPSTQGFGMTRYSCPSIGSFPGDPEACVGTAPTDTELGGESAAETTWPTDSTMYIKYSGSGFQTSKYEGDLGIGWEPDTTYGAIDFSFEGGTRFGRAEPNASGGLLIYETGSCGGAATGVITETHASGALAGYHPTTHLTHLRPKS